METKRLTISFAGNSEVIFAQIGERVILSHGCYHVIDGEADECKNDELYKSFISLSNNLMEMKDVDRVEIKIDFNSGWTSVVIGFARDDKSRASFKMLFNVYHITSINEAVFNGTDTANLIVQNVNRDELKVISNHLRIALDA